MPKSRYYFSTRDLLTMAVLAALGGVISTYVNAVGDFFQAWLGFAGTTQWAAGLHVLWLILAVGLTRKQGAGTITGLLKGGVEFLSGNTHGVLVVLIDVVAGILVDLALLPFQRARRPGAMTLAYCLAGGLASASNVFVFQLFAAVPADTLAMGAMLLVAGVAFASGVLLAGLLGQTLLAALGRAGVVKDRPVQPMGRWVYPVFLGVVIVLTIGVGAYLRVRLQGPPVVHIAGEVDAPYDYVLADDAQVVTIKEQNLPGLIGTYTGVPLWEVISHAQPRSNASAVLVKATDGYDFFISMNEVQTNERLILAHTGSGQVASYRIAGAANSKAWVRNVMEIQVVAQAVVEVRGALSNAYPYNPDEWQFEMDNARLDLGYGARKYQGVALGKVLEAMRPKDAATAVALKSGDGQEVTLALTDVLTDDHVRLFNYTAEQGIAFAVARDDGHVWLTNVVEIEVR
ncbi:MAG: ECF transporter S component [Chloroflexota bacterium]|nr:ECF transporter S component [Chloroflexota bacterium]